MNDLEKLYEDFHAANGSSALFAVSLFAKMKAFAQLAAACADPEHAEEIYEIGNLMLNSSLQEMIAYRMIDADQVEEFLSNVDEFHEAGKSADLPAGSILQ